MPLTVFDFLSITQIKCRFSPSAARKQMTGRPPAVTALKSLPHGPAQRQDCAGDCLCVLLSLQWCAASSSHSETVIKSLMYCQAAERSTTIVSKVHWLVHTRCAAMPLVWVAGVWTCHLMALDDRSGVCRWQRVFLPHWRNQIPRPWHCCSGFFLSVNRWNWQNWRGKVKNGRMKR